MSIADRAEVAELRGRITQLEQRLEGLVQRLNELEVPGVHGSPITVEIAPLKPRKIQQMCPHCNKVPAKFFHVRSCPEKT